MKFIDLKQGSKEWLSFRKSKIGASDAPVIMGVSPWKDVNQLYIEKTNCTEKTYNSNYAMRRGIELEPVALALFELETGYLMSPKVAMHDSIEWMSASFDGLEIDSKACVEIKCPGKIDHECALDGEIPKKYIPQLQHQMEVSGLNKIYYLSYSITTWKILELSKDEEYIRDMLEKERSFWDCFSKKEPPPLIGFPKKEMNSNEWNHLSTKWKEVSRRIKELEKEQEELKSHLIRIADNENATGNGLFVQKYFRKGNVDYSSIPEIKKIDVEKYRKPPSECWKISSND